MLGCKPNLPTGRLKPWVYQPKLRCCSMQFRVTFSCISLYMNFYKKPLICEDVKWSSNKKI